MTHHNLYEVRPARLADCEYIAQHLREADVREVSASHGLTPREALELSFNHSEISFTSTFRTEPLFMFGRSHVTNNAACVWLLGAKQMRRHSRHFLKVTRDSWPMLHRGCPLLYNYVDERNLESIRWLLWGGAKFIARHSEFGHERRPFIEFIHFEDQPLCVSSQP